MKILFLTRLYWPHVGGVEKQVGELSKRLVSKGFKVTILTEKYDESLKSYEKVDGINIVRISRPKIRFLGLLYIWLWLLLHIKLITKSGIVHSHGSMIWYWPFRLLLPKKPVYTTFHGWEGTYPIPWKNKIIRKIDAVLAWKNITIHDYVEKYYGIKADLISYTAVDAPKKTYFNKDLKRLVYVGRLDDDTGLALILKALGYLRGFRVDFCGDGPLRKKCQNYGKVHGFGDPSPFFAKAFICLSPGVTSILEAFAFKCLIITTYDNPLKKDYLLMTPFSKWIFVEQTAKKMAERIKFFLRYPNEARPYTEKSYEWVKTQNWENEVNKYLNLWGVKPS